MAQEISQRRKSGDDQRPYTRAISPGFVGSGHAHAMKRAIRPLRMSLNFWRSAGKIDRNVFERNGLAAERTIETTKRDARKSVALRGWRRADADVASYADLEELPADVAAASGL